jgi:hypothetical protein
LFQRQQTSDKNNLLHSSCSTTVTLEPTIAPTEDLPPSPAPNPTMPPASQNLRVLSPYQLVYTLSESRVPFRSELVAVVELTRLYLDSYFKDEFQEDGDLLEILTIFLNTAFDFGEPIPVEYESSAVFDPESSISIPTVEDLDAVLISAFEGSNLDGYLGMLQALPPQNLFSKTVDVELTEPSIGDPLVEQNTSSQRDLSTATAAMAGTSGLLLIIAGAVLMRRRPENEEESEEEGSILGAKPCNTISDETTTTEATWSCDQMTVPISRRPNNNNDDPKDYHNGHEACDDISPLYNPLGRRNRRSR